MFTSRDWGWIPIRGRPCTHCILRALTEIKASTKIKAFPGKNAYILIYFELNTSHTQTKWSTPLAGVVLSFLRLQVLNVLGLTVFKWKDSRLCHFISEKRTDSAPRITGYCVVWGIFVLFRLAISRRWSANRCNYPGLAAHWRKKQNQQVKL